MYINAYIILMIFIGIFSNKNFCKQLYETEAEHYYKAIIPYETSDVDKVDLYSWVGNDEYDEHTHSFLINFEDDGYDDWLASVWIGNIEESSIDGVKDVICLWKSNFSREKYGNYLIGTLFVNGYVKDVYAPSVISANHSVYKHQATVDKYYPEFEEIDYEEYQSYKNTKNKFTDEEENVKSKDNGEWHEDIDGWRYFDNDLLIDVKGWYKIDGIWYYFYKENGVMASNTYIDGYYLDSNGKCIY